MIGGVRQKLPWPEELYGVSNHFISQPVVGSGTSPLPEMHASCQMTDFGF